jgi:hypothetical protein
VGVTGAGAAATGAGRGAGTGAVVGAGGITAGASPVTGSDGKGRLLTGVRLLMDPWSGSAGAICFGFATGLSGFVRVS